VAERLVAVNSCQGQVKIIQKLSSQLTVGNSSSSSGGDGDGGMRQDQAAVAADLPDRPSLVVHEIFGTDPLSEHVLPALRHVQVCALELNLGGGEDAPGW